MARPLRVEYPGALYHLTSRGNAGEAIFRDDADRRRFLDTLSDVIARHCWACHAYCLMENHYHLVIETPEGSLSRGMQLLNGVYTQWFNRRHQRTGHLFQGRFRAILVERESYLLELTRYVVLNPVRAGMVGTPRDWPWSSYLATAGYIEPSSYLTMDWILSQFDSDRERAIRAYRRFVQEGRGVRVWDDLKAGWLLGSTSFVDSLRPRIQEKPLTPEYRQRERLATRPSLEELFAGITEREARDERIHQAVRVHRYTLNEVGAYVGLLYSTISAIAKKVDERRRRP